VAAAQIGQTATWLDSPPTPFNTAGAPIPKPLPADQSNLDRCAQQERPPVGPEESQVAAAGWRLEQYWPTQRNGGTTVVLGLAGYDGMCRPWGFNGFAFADGRFAGTISPNPMYSRADGSLEFGTPTIAPDGRVAARFVRYAPQDPLCCPSRGQTAVTYRIDRATAGPILVPERIVQIPPVATPTPAATPAPTAPTQLPATGGLPPAVPVVGAAFALLTGLIVRRRSTRES
jgi:hypothetical protein